MRLIDADALIEKCGEWYTEEGPEEGYIGPLKHLLNKQPTIEPKQGEWVHYYPIMMSIEEQKFYGAKNPKKPIPDKRFGRIKCSICGGPHPASGDSYCPNCGAKMKGAIDETD